MPCWGRETASSALRSQVMASPVNGATEEHDEAAEVMSSTQLKMVRAQGNYNPPEDAVLGELAHITELAQLGDRGLPEDGMLDDVHMVPSHPTSKSALPALLYQEKLWPAVWSLEAAGSSRPGRDLEHKVICLQCKAPLAIAC